MEKETSDTRTLLEEILKILMIVHLTLEEWKKDLEIQKGFFVLFWIRGLHCQQHFKVKL